MKSRTTLTFQNRNLIVADTAMEDILKLATRAAASPSPVLICGESGTGKELIARFIHEKSARSNEPFVSINCAAIPEGLMEAELFGYERGAFTGAVSQRIGKFEQAHRGTLLLDEISEMKLGLQAKLLRVLQEGEVDRLGARGTVAINTRIIATTNKDPMQLIGEEKFREDLFYRLNVIRIDCLPLEKRPEAILNLTHQFVNQSTQRQEKNEMRLSEEAIHKLVSYRWPGNVRELQNAVERAVLLCEEDVLKEEHFCFLSLPHREKTVGGTRTLAALEQEHICSVLETVQGNRTAAARLLGISVRTLRNKLKEYQVG